MSLLKKCKHVAFSIFTIVLILTGCDNTSKPNTPSKSLPNDENPKIFIQIIGDVGGWAECYAVDKWINKKYISPNTDEAKAMDKSLKNWNTAEETFILAGYAREILGKELEKSTARINSESEEKIIEIKKSCNFKLGEFNARLKMPAPAAAVPAPEPALAAVPAPEPAPAAVPAPEPAPAAAVPAPAMDSSLFAPSFDCSKASNAQEKLVCSDRELSKIDVEMSQAYAKARDRTSDKDALRKAQTEWIKQIFRSCSDKNCLTSAYKNRISELQK